MLPLLKKIVYITTFNFSLFLLLMIGIQNSSKKEKVNFIIGKTIKLPIAFITGVSFISGSLSGMVLTKTNFKEEK